MAASSASTGAAVRRGFRLDINGLRSIAVVSVVLFHLGGSPVHGGYVGVDIFFVISGYLMSQIIVSRLDQDGFSIWGFWWQRFSRIVPALACLCVVLLLLGWVSVE